MEETFGFGGVERLVLVGTAVAYDIIPSVKGSFFPEIRLHTTVCALRSWTRSGLVSTPRVRSPTGSIALARVRIS
jgi:hypothetical protein